MRRHTQLTMLGIACWLLMGGIATDGFRFKRSRAVVDGRFNVGVRCGDHPHVDGDVLAAADPAQGAGLEHAEQAHLQLTREPYPSPAMRINPEVKSVFDFRYEDFRLEHYDPHPHIPAPVAV